MEELKILLQKILNKDLQQIILSNSRHPEQTQKVKIRPVLIREELLFQETAYRGTQAFHENFTAEQLTDRICTALQEQFRQGEFSAKTLQATALVSKKGKLTLKVKNSGKAPRTAASEEEELQALAHNRTKHYILEEGKPVDFLVGLGVQTPDGRVTRARFDKFRQINRYLEFIEDVIDELPKDRTIRIIDFGCGKSYLTFAMYYYLHELQHRDIQVTGLDLKTDVIRHCNELAEKLGYDRLKFERGDISTYEGTDVAEMAVTLNARDLGKDYALEKAGKWGGGWPESFVSGWEGGAGEKGGGGLQPRPVPAIDFDQPRCVWQRCARGADVPGNNETLSSAAGTDSGLAEAVLMN